MLGQSHSQNKMDKTILAEYFENESRYVSTSIKNEYISNLIDHACVGLGLYS